MCFNLLSLTLSNDTTYICLLPHLFLEQGVFLLEVQRRPVLVTSQNEVLLPGLGQGRLHGNQTPGRRLVSLLEVLHLALQVLCKIQGDLC